ncbi:hypothetical protein D3C84_123610 [compost metagenome]
MAIEPQVDGQLLPKLTDWPKEPDLRSLKLDFENAQQHHSGQMAKIDRWSRLMKGTGTPKVKGRSSVQPKLIQQQAEWRYAALSEPFLGSNKIAKVSPITFEDTAGAKQNELVLNWQFRTKLNRVKLIDDFVRTVVDEGTCILRTGWCRHTITVMVDQPVFEHYAMTTEEQLNAFQQAYELSQADPHTYNDSVAPELKAAVDYYNESGEPTFAVVVGTQKVATERVLENKPVVDILNPRNVVIDPSCLGDVDKATFAVVSFETNKAELLKWGKRYKNLEHVNWEGNTPVATNEYATTTPDSFNFADAMRKKVVAYEYWGFYDIRDEGRLVPFVATWIGDVLIRMEENPYPDEKLPFVVVTYRPIKRDLYGEPDAELLEDQQNILGAVTRGMIDLLGRSANAQQGFAKGMLDPLNRRRYDNGQDYEFNPNANPAQNLIEHKMPELPQSALTMIAMQNNQAESLTGVKAFSGGVTGEAYGDVAAGIRGALDAASKREMGILRRLAKGMAEVFVKIIAMNAVFLSEQEVIRVTNGEFITVKREDLAGNYDLEVDISTAEVDNQKSQDLSFMLQTLGPNGDPSMVIMILAEIAELKRMPELAQKLRNFKPEPSPEQQKLQQLEIQNKELENQKLQSEIELNQAKAQFEMSRKDKTDLDYVEQETGTQHERDMQKQRAQSQGNQNLQVTKALTTPTKEGEQKPNLNAAIGFNSISDKLNDDRPSSTIQRDELVGQRPPAFNPVYQPPVNV